MSVYQHVLELHAGQRIHEHGAEFAAAGGNCFENGALACGEALVAGAERGELLPYQTTTMECCNG